jgi:hypothetical protein
LALWLGSDLRLALPHPPYTLRGLSGAYLRGGAVSVSALCLNLSAGTPQCNSSAHVTPLSADFLSDLAGHDEVLVTSREGSTRGTVPVWFVIAPPGVVYLFGFGFSEKARRWRTDPWIRLSVPGAGHSVEGVAHFVGPAELDGPVGNLIVERWSMQGAPTIEGLRRTLRDGVHVLVRVEGEPES